MLYMFATPLIAKQGKHLLHRRAPHTPVGTVLGAVHERAEQAAAQTDPTKAPLCLPVSSQFGAVLH